MSDASMINLSLDRSSKTPLFQQIYEDLKGMISDNKIQSDYRLPSSRAFAKELGISRSSVVTAYEQLLAEGYIESRQGSGYFVCNIPELNLSEVKLRKNYKTPHKETPNVKGALAPGLPDMKLFPYQNWAKCVAKVARENPHSLINMVHPYGDHKLREAICKHLEEWRGISTEPQQVIVTPGAFGALEIIIQVLMKPADTIGIENPGYQTFTKYISRLGLDKVLMNVDQYGAKLPGKNNKKIPKLMVITPSHQFPLGGTMPTARRTDFLNYAEQTGCWLVEDDFDSEFRYEGRPIPALASMDHSERVLYVGSFSKIFSASIRLGYLVIPKQLIDNFTKHLDSRGTGASISAQSALAEFIMAGEFHKHIRKMRRIYSARRQIFIKELESLGKYINFSDNQAGMQLALYLNDQDLPDMDLCQLTKNAGLACQPLSRYYVNNVKQGLQIGFCADEEQVITASMKKLKNILSRKRKSPGS